MPPPKTNIMLQTAPLLLLLLLLTCKCSSQQSPLPPPTTTTNDYLKLHNEARSSVNVPPLQWSQTLTQSASLTVRFQRDKQNCTFANLSKSRYGGNQLWSQGYDVTPASAVEAWVAEKKFYNYENNSCTDPEHARCGVYTQVVWRKSLELGCAQAKCVDKGSSSSLTVCFYDPPGNVVGEKPY